MSEYFKSGRYGDVKFTKSKPGYDWNYSNIGVSLAAYIIELRSGMYFSRFTNTYIFRPLALEDTYWTASASDSLLHTSYYEPSGDSIINVYTRDVVLYSSGDMITNITDLTTYCQAVMSKKSRLLQLNSFDIILTPKLNRAVTNLEDDNKGIFFMIDRNNYGINYQLTGMDGGDNFIKSMM
jgi:CubicO group peptidase (beta-lactamase class C family)